MEIDGYNNYLIYEDGRVYSKKSKIYLKPSLNLCGYYIIALYKNNIRKGIPLHRLLALHYIPNTDNKPCIDHKNRIRTDNRIENLRWATHKENCNNRSMRCDNSSGHLNICWDKPRKRWKVVNLRKFKRFKSKTDAICYKFIMLLMSK
tara:strand:+ start:597 stop:1040 length:444 start_codon:yes stop_codon:yes gene_type:complete